MKKNVKYYEIEMSKWGSKNGQEVKKNETSMCILATSEPSIKEAEKFLARDIVHIMKCDHIDSIKEISQEEAYSAYSMDDIEETLPVFEK